MKDSLVQQCLEVLQREDVKNECKAIFKPVLDFILYEFRPYIYMTISLVFVIFILNLANLILFVFLLRNQTFFSSKKPKKDDE
jgi:hypothetical protein